MARDGSEDCPATSRNEIVPTGRGKRGALRAQDGGRDGMVSSSASSPKRKWASERRTRASCLPIRGLRGASCRRRRRSAATRLRGPTDARAHTLNPPQSRCLGDRGAAVDLIRLLSRPQSRYTGARKIRQPAAATVTIQMIPISTARGAIDSGRRFPTESVPTTASATITATASHVAIANNGNVINRGRVSAGHRGRGGRVGDAPRRPGQRDRRGP